MNHMPGKKKRSFRHGLERSSEVLSTGGYSLLGGREEAPKIEEPRNPAEIKIGLDRVKGLVEVCHERFDENVALDWVVDFNLPDLYVAIEDLYAATGESESLHLAREKRASPGTTTQPH